MRFPKAIKRTIEQQVQLNKDVQLISKLFDKTLVNTTDYLNDVTSFVDNRFYLDLNLFYFLNINDSETIVVQIEEELIEDFSNALLELELDQETKDKITTRINELHKFIMKNGGYKNV